MALGRALYGSCFDPEVGKNASSPSSSLDERRTLIMLVHLQRSVVGRTAAPARARRRGAAATRATASPLKALLLGAETRLALARDASRAALVASLPAAPPCVRAAAAAQAARSALRLYAATFYSGDEQLAASDARYYTDGFALLARDARRAGPLLFATASVSPVAGARRGALLADLRALFPFAFLVLNTFPLTPAVLRPLRETAWLKADAWLLPSSFTEARQLRLRRARRLFAEALPPSPLPVGASCG